VLVLEDNVRLKDFEYNEDLQGSLIFMVVNNGACLINHMYHSKIALGGKQGKVEKALSTSKDFITESAKETLEEKPKEGKGVEITKDNDVLSLIFVHIFSNISVSINNFLACFDFLN